MATVNCTLSYVRTMDKGTNEGSATYHFGYGKAGQRWVTCYKVTVPSYTGTSSSITFSLSVNRGTAYPTNKNSTWKVALDETAPVWSAADGAYTAGSAYAAGYYDKQGSWQGTFSGSITSTTVSKTVTISTSSAILDSGNTFYVYLFSGANAYNSIKVTSISAYITYSSEAVTGTTLYVGTTSSPASTTVYPTPNKRTVYYKVAGLANPVSGYAYFRVYLSNGFSFTNGETYSNTSSLGTLVKTYTNASSSAYEFTDSFTIPDTSFPIGSNTGIVVVASTTAYPNRYWRIGGSGNTPKTCYIYPKPEDWFLNTVHCSALVTGKNSVTYYFTHATKNDPKYIKWLGAFTTSVPYSTSGHGGGSTGIWDYSCGSLNISASAANTTYSFTQSGLSAGTSYTRYLQAGARSETPYYANSAYYGLGSVSFTTDADYSATISANVTSSTTATLSMSNLNSTINLLGATWIVSTTNTTSTKDISSFANCFECDTGSSDSDAGANIYEFISPEEYTVSCTGLSPGTQYTMYAYVFSDESDIWYKCGSVTFTTDQSSYTGTISTKVTGSTTATISLSNLSSTTNLDNYWYISASSTSPASTDYMQSIGSDAWMTQNSIPKITAGTSHTFYIYVKSDVTGKYYKIGSTTFTTDQSSYTATISGTVSGSSAASFTISDLSSTTNLDSNWYLSTSSSSYSSGKSAARTTSISLTSSTTPSLAVASSNTLYAYVKSSASGKYYKVGSVTVKTHSYIYYGEDLTPCWTYMLIDNVWTQVVLDVPNYVSS